MTLFSKERILAFFLVALTIAACSRTSSPLPHSSTLPLVPGNAESRNPAQATDDDGDKDQDPPEVAIGQRLFRETRFSQYFASHSNGDVNRSLEKGDPRFEFLETPQGRIANPYAGSGVNCASCHLVSETLSGPGSRAYGDFARRSAVPEREDGKTTTLRNAPAFVDSAISRDSEFFLHADAQFSSVEDLVRGGFTGRNFGWLSGEAPQAIANLARVIREDNGSGKLAQEYGGSYRRVLLGTDPTLEEKFRIPESFRIDVTQASDTEILDSVAKLVGAYIRSIQFKRDSNGEYNGSPYDLFLKKNHLPRKAQAGEAPLAYASRLAGLLERLDFPQFVSESDGAFKYHAQKFAFGAKELQGLKVFLRRSGVSAGNCVACHTPPTFTDFSFHNTGASQEEYDSIHGSGSFSKLPIPSYAERNQIYASHPDGAPLARFESVPNASHGGACDLGVWNVFGNPTIPMPQASLLAHFCKKQGLTGQNCSVEKTLPRAVAAFKTPTIRDLGQSAPYFHSGRMATIEAALKFYQKGSEDARAGKMRNADPELTAIRLQDEDVDSLAAFLRSLNEDYD